MHGDRDKIISSGFDGYLSKPINSALLLKELAHLLKKTTAVRLKQGVPTASDGPVMS